jgi:hypothetical protein
VEEFIPGFLNESSMERLKPAKNPSTPGMLAMLKSLSERHIKIASSLLQNNCQSIAWELVNGVRLTAVPETSHCHSGLRRNDGGGYLNFISHISPLAR